MSRCNKRQIENLIMENGAYITQKESVLGSKGFAFALRIGKLNKFLVEKKREFILSKQVVPSGTLMGALIREWENASSRKVFFYKLTIALKRLPVNTAFSFAIHT